MELDAESVMAPLPDKVPIVVVSQPQLSRDEIVLARFGKNQRLKRRFGLLPAIGLTCTMTITWDTLLNGLENGGPAGLIYGYLLVWAGTIVQMLVMAEMASMIPLSGGPFNWVAILSPPWCRKFLSYLAGWLEVITFIAAVAASCYVSGTLVQGLLILNDSTYGYQRWHGTLLFWAFLAISTLVNTHFGSHLPQIEKLLLLLHFFGFFAVMISILYLGPHQSAHEVFSTFYDFGGWDSMPLAFFVGLITCTNSFPGFDAADHIAEEIEDAPRVIPLAIGSSVMINGALGFAMLLALLFCLPDDVSSILNSDTYYPFINIYAYALGSNAGASVLTCLIICAQVFSNIAILATASRMIWSFAREGGLPFSDYLSEVDAKTLLPYRAVGVTAVINLLLALINIGSSVGFRAFISLIVAGYWSSFLLAAGVMLNKRLTTPSSEIPWGPFRLGKAGVPLTVLAIVFSLAEIFFSMWPAAVDPTPVSMNYCVLGYGAALSFSLAFWVLYGRKKYKGPILEISDQLSLYL